MNRFKIVGFAMVFAAGMVLAAGTPWWTAKAPHGQVAFPWVVACKDDDSKFDDQNPDNECWSTLGGWWFGYIAGPVIGPNTNGCRVDMAGLPPGTSKKGDAKTTNYVEAKINGNMVSFVGTDYPTCLGPDVTNRLDGVSTLLDGYLDLEFAVGEGINGEGEPKKWEPSIAALGVNFSTPPGGLKGTEIPVFVEKDMTSFGGFCLKYESDHTKSDNFSLRLGWDQTGVTADKNRFKYDPWIAKIPPGTGIQTKDFLWTYPDSLKAKCKVGGKCGDFEQEGWADGALPITSALTKMLSVNLDFSSYTPGVIHFKLYAFGPAGTCDGDFEGNTPIIPSKNIKNVNFTLNGRMLSVDVAKPAMVQIYNLQGAIVKSQTLSPNSNTMNLSNLPTGIYMVRSSSLGYTSRIVIK